MTIAKRGGSIHAPTNKIKFPWRVLIRLKISFLNCLYFSDVYEMLGSNSSSLTAIWPCHSALEFWNFMKNKNFKNKSIVLVGLSEQSLTNHLFLRDFRIVNLNLRNFLNFNLNRAWKGVTTDVWFSSLSFISS